MGEKMPSLQQIKKCDKYSTKYVLIFFTHLSVYHSILFQQLITSQQDYGRSHTSFTFMIALWIAANLYNSNNYSFNSRRKISYSPIAIFTILFHNYWLMPGTEFLPK